MTDWQKVLEPLGWSQVKQSSPILAAVVAARMNEFGGRTRKTASASREAATLIGKIHDALNAALRGLEDLPEPDLREIAKGILAEQSLEEQRLTGANAFTPPEDFSDHAAIAALDIGHEGATLILRGLRNYRKRLEADAEQSARGAPPNLAARAVADAAAMVYVVGRGDIPGLGRKADGTGLSGEYGAAIEALLAILGIQCADALRPADDALSALCEDEARLAACIHLHEWSPGDPDPFALSLQ